MMKAMLHSWIPIRSLPQKPERQRKPYYVFSQFNILISGCGGAGRHVAQVAADDGRGLITGLVDPEQAQLDRLLEQYPDAVSGSDYARILQETQPDFVVVAGPDHLHAEQTVMALEQGCHVLVEKPLATTVADAQRILDAEAQSGRQVMTDQTLRYMYPWHEMAQLAKSGDIGDIFFVQGDYIHDMWSHYSPEGKHHTPWRIDQQNPQNILLGGGCHPLDLILWTVNSPVTEVYAYSNKLSIPVFPADDCYIVILQFENGVTGKVFVTSGCSGHGMGEGMGGGFLAVYGTEGTLWQGKLYRRDAEPVALEAAFTDAAVGGHGWGRSVVDFLDLLEGKVENPIPAYWGARIVSVCEAAFEAIRTKRPQTPHWFWGIPERIMRPKDDSKRDERKETLQGLRYGAFEPVVVRNSLELSSQNYGSGYRLGPHYLRKCI